MTSNWFLKWNCLTRYNDSGQLICKWEHSKYLENIPRRPGRCFRFKQLDKWKENGKTFSLTLSMPTNNFTIPKQRIHKLDAMRRISCSFATGIVGLFLLILSLGFLLFGTKNLVRMWAWQSLTLRNGSKGMDWWRQPEGPFSFKVYIFNVTNPESVSNGAQPIFSQIGPYVYEQYHEKVNVKKLTNFTLSYNMQNFMIFNEGSSRGLKESDLVTVINVPLVAVILMVYEAAPEFAGVLEGIWPHLFPYQKSIFITTTVRELLFDGITIECSSVTVDVFFYCRILENLNIRFLRKKRKQLKFAFFYHINGTEEETFRVHQGIQDVRKAGKIIEINNSSLLHFWKNDYCNMINGSDGTQFPLLLDKTQTIYNFDKVLCRSVYAELEEVIYKNDIILNKYSASENLLASPNVSPENKCFCRSKLRVENLFEDPSERVVEDTGSDGEVCLGKGVLSLMPCVGIPLVASFPHFYLGDPAYFNYSGLTPVKELHETYAYVEPATEPLNAYYEAFASSKTEVVLSSDWCSSAGTVAINGLKITTKRNLLQTSGVTLSSFKRIQLNLEVKKIPDVEIASNLPEGLFPVLWTEEERNLSPDLVKFLKYKLIKKKILEYGTWVSIAVGSSFVLFAVLTNFFSRKWKKFRGND